MTERLTAEQVAAEIEKRSRAAFGTNISASHLLADVAELVRANLVTCWQAEPDGEGWYWVEGVEFPCYIEETDVDEIHDNGEWSVNGWNSDGTGLDYRPLNGRRVAPVLGRPE